jgi:AraC-like DNA-binding protein
MFVFEYDTVNYSELLQEMANAFAVPVEEDRLNYPPQIADGFTQVVRMQGPLQAMVYEYRFAQPFRLRRKKIQQEYYTLWFTEIQEVGQVKINIDNDWSQLNEDPFSVALMTSSLFESNYEISAGTRARGVNILLDNQWLAEHLGVNSQSGLLHKYLSLKNARVSMEPLDAEYKKLLSDVIDLVKGNAQFKQIAIQNRIMMLIERFFLRIAAKMESNTLHIGLSREDIHRVMEVESFITSDLFSPAPYIQELAKKVNISETKLKNNFRTVFGMPIYQYFQKARMQAARDVLESNKYSIKQVALEMGYHNLSNFSTAFKKEFGILPSQLAKPVTQG